MSPAEYNKCVDDHADKLYRFILKNIKDEDKAKDIVQDTFEKLWLKCPEVEFLKAKSWMFTTSYRHMIDLIRRDKKQTGFETVKYSSLSYDDNYSDLQEVLHKAVNNLPAIQKSVILLRDYEGYSYQEISEISGLSEAQVKVYIFRARLYLKKYLGSLEKVL